MDIRCRKRLCKYNDKFTCTAKEININPKIVCDMYERDPDKKVADTTKRLLEEPPCYAPQRDSKALKISCQAKCLFNHNGQCVIKSMLLQTTIVDKDDLQNNIAWNEESESKEIDTDIPKIVGDKKAMLGSKKIYKCSKEIDNKRWEIGCSPELNQVIDFKVFDENDYCEIKFPTSVRFVGELIKLNLFIEDTLKDTLEIVIKSI